MASSNTTRSASSTVTASTVTGLSTGSVSNVAQLSSGLVVTALETPLTNIVADDIRSSLKASE